MSKKQNKRYVKKSIRQKEKIGESTHDVMLGCAARRNWGQDSPKQ